jgi:hypothetical protein
MPTLKQIVSGARLSGKEPPLEKVEVGIPGKPQEIIFHKGKIYVYNQQGQALINGGILSALGIEAGAISAEKLTSASRQFILNLTWVNTNYDKVSWNAGTIYWNDGTTSTVNSGNTGNMKQTTYLYYDGSPNLRKTNNYKEITGSNKVIIAAIVPGADATELPVTTVFLSTGTTIDGDKITTGKVQSADGLTYFDLDDGEIVINDGTDNVIAIYP